MKLSVPTNWQTDLLENLDVRNIDQIYGKLHADFFGGGRASALGPVIQRKKAAEHIRSIHKKGIAFNYLLNSSCLGNREWNHRGQKNIQKLLDWLLVLGVESVTVSLPYLLQVVKKCYPSLKVHVSVMAAVNNPISARYWQDMGADQITLSFTEINRDFEVLRKIRKAVSCRLQLIANLPCLYGCPYHLYHAGLTSHASQVNDPNGGFVIDYCSLSCRHVRLQEPYRLISSGWIRPEDLHYYEEIGIDRIKLVDRIMKTEFILSIVQAYTENKYEGNLLDLFTLDKNKCLLFAKPYLFHKLKYFFHPFKADIFKMQKLQKLLDCNGFFLDNQKLEGFLDFFVSGKCRHDCDGCSYCKDVAASALRLPKEDAYRQKLDLSVRLLDDIVSGRAFYVRGRK